MANYNSLKATIDAQIKANGVQAITGPILNAVLTAMINTIGNGYTLQGSVAQTTDNPGAPDNPVAYLAAGPGTYTNFGGTVIPNDGHAYLLTWDTSWHAVQLPLPTFDLANGKQDALTFDDAPTPGSDNPVKSGGIAEALDDKQNKATGDTAGHVAVMDGNGNAVDGGEALADLATKEDVEAVEQEVAQIAGEAGLAEAVIDTDGAGTEQEFTFRKSGGDGGAYYRKIKGKTLAVDNQLASNDAEAVETTGVNQWDEEWEVGSLIGSGRVEPLDSTRRTTSYIPVLPNTTYYFTGPAGAGNGRIEYYDKEKNSLYYTSGYAPFENTEFTTIDGAYYMRMTFGAAYGTTYNHDICINLSNPAINGQYFPYWKRTLQLGLTTKEDTDGNVPFADGMKGAGTASDWADKVGGEVVMDEIDLGDMDWGLAGANFFAAPISGVKATGDNSIPVNMICAKYESVAWSNLADKTISIDGNSAAVIGVVDAAYSDVSTFKAAMQGVKVIFQRNTPVPFTWKEPLNLGVKVDEGGTERAVAPEGATAPSAPFVADTTYTMSIARMVAKLQSI